jgi:hypothetical protein
MGTGHEDFSGAYLGSDLCLLLGHHGLVPGWMAWRQEIERR